MGMMMPMIMMVVTMMILTLMSMMVLMNAMMMVMMMPSVLTITQPSNSFTEAPTANELRDNFDTLDTNNSDGLTLAEAQVQIPGLTTNLFNQLDDDSNGDT